MTDFLVSALAELASQQTSDLTLAAALDRVLRLTCMVVPTCDACTITLAFADGARAGAASDPAAQQIDAHQRQLSEGPTIDAWRERTVITTEALSAQRRWPQLAAAIGRGSFESVLAHPLVTPAGEVIGVLTMYSRMLAALGDRALTALATWATPVAVTLVNAHFGEQMVAVRLQAAAAGERNQAAAAPLSPEVPTPPVPAVTTGEEPVVDRAVAVLMEREQVEAEEALAHLRRLAEELNMPLPSVARDVVRSGARL